MSVVALKTAMLALPQSEALTRDFFHGGMYVRAVEAVATTTIVGKLHKRPHLFFLAAGSVAMVDGDNSEIFHAPRMLQSEPGAQRAIHALTDCLFFTIHATETTDTASAEAEMVEPDPDSPFGIGNTLKALQ
jgi:hypothetical protein